MFILDTDASNTAIETELAQEQDGKEVLISFNSKILTSTQRKYCVTRRELLAVVAITRHYRYYLLGRPFILRTDHNSLAWLLGFKNIEGSLPVGWRNCHSMTLPSSIEVGRSIRKLMDSLERHRVGRHVTVIMLDVMSVGYLVGVWLLSESTCSV